MGTEITLDIASASIDSAKNYMGVDHGSLFQSDDHKPLPEEYRRIYGCEDKDVGRGDSMGFQRTLGNTVSRLELLGYSMKVVRDHYDKASGTCSEERESINQMYSELVRPTTFMDFDEFMVWISEYPLDELSDVYSFDLNAPRSDVIGCFHDEKRINLLPFYDDNEMGYSEQNHFVNALTFLPPYSVLRVLAEIPKNKDQNITWLYGPLVENGWAAIDDFIPETRRADKFLIVTEGTSDIYILQEAINLCRPELSDFFRFIETKENHPFSGAGNLVKFAEGLAKIDVHNKVLFLLDNDTEGKKAHNKILDMQLPPNMRATTLPYHDSFECINSLGPTGEVITNINGQAVAIECFLDFEQDGLPPPQVRWTSYDKNAHAYQGELVKKELYFKSFKKSKQRNYDFTKLNFLLDHIIEECRQISVP